MRRVGITSGRIYYERTCTIEKWDPRGDALVGLPTRHLLRVGYERFDWLVGVGDSFIF